MEHVMTTPNTMSGPWDLGFVLPNLRLRDGDEEAARLGARLTAKHIALVPPTDPRVGAMRKQWSAADSLLSGFRGVAGNPVQPAVLIYERHAPDSVNKEAIVAFRNAVALAVALPSWLDRGDNAQFIYSDIFDFYPTTVARDGETLITISPALRAYWSRTVKFVGMPSPYVTTVTFKLGEDAYLLHALLEEWERAYTVPDGEDSFRRALFRSLELAYAALATPVRNQGSLYDWGISLSLWVTALEILAHPQAMDEEGAVWQGRVLDLLGSYTWLGERMGVRSHLVCLGGKWRVVNLIELACHRLYRARHQFIHGDRLAGSDLWPFGEDCAPLFQLAPTLYRLALRAYLADRHPRLNDKAPGDIAWGDGEIAALVADHYLEGKIAELFDDVNPDA